MDEFDDEDEYGFEEVAESGRRRFMRQDIVVIGLDLIYEVSSAFTRTFLLARNTAAMHANWVASQHEFHQEAALEIEAMTNGEADG
jgi:hypothetical protein